MKHAAAHRRPWESVEPPGTLVGASPAMQAIRRKIARLAGQDTPVLISGETGTGKNLVARAIHGAETGFFDLEAAALPEDLLEAEVFGVERGALDRAREPRPGMLECASGGTVCFHNFPLWPRHLWPRLLRLRRDGVVVRMGGDQPIPVNVRIIIVVTSADPRTRVQVGVLSRKIFGALTTERVHLPPLRERGDDIAVLARHFARVYAAAYGDVDAGFTDEALARLREYPWPGNVRELANVVERALALRQPWTPTRRRSRVPEPRPIGLDELPPGLAYSSPTLEA